MLLATKFNKLTPEVQEKAIEIYLHNLHNYTTAQEWSFYLLSGMRELAKCLDVILDVSEATFDLDKQTFSCPTTVLEHFRSYVDSIEAYINLTGVDKNDIPEWFIELAQEREMLDEIPIYGNYVSQKLIDDYMQEPDIDIDYYTGQYYSALEIYKENRSDFIANIHSSILVRLKEEYEFYFSVECAIEALQDDTDSLYDTETGKRVDMYIEV